MPLYLQRAEFQNVRGFRNLELDFGTPQAPRLWTVVIGNNGHGKSSILRGIALGLCDQKTANALLLKVPGSFIRTNKKGFSEESARIRLTFTTSGKSAATHTLETRVIRAADGSELIDRTRSEEETFPWTQLFVCGYGVNRGTRGTAARSVYSLQNGLATLFDDRVDLLDPESVLRDFKLRTFEQQAQRRKRPKERRGRAMPDSFEELRKILWKLWDLQPMHKLEVASDKVTVHGPWGGLPFHALGDGYRGTAGWVLDLLGAYLKAGQWEPRSAVTGIVLIDEVDEHLHPSWQKRVIPQLKRLFPGLQFIATTHSPLTIVNTAPGEVVATTLHNAVAELDTNPLPDPTGKTANEILTDWFGVTSSLDSASEALLRKYRSALARRKKSDVYALRKKLEQRVGSFVTSPLDELAVEIAADLRKQLSTEMPKPERARLVHEHATFLRKRLAESK